MGGSEKKAVNGPLVNTDVGSHHHWQSRWQSRFHLSVWCTSHRTGCKQTVMGSLKRIIGSQNSPDLNPMDYHVWAPCWKSTINCTWGPRRLISWKSLCRVATRTHQQNGGKLYQALDCKHGCRWRSLQASAVKVHFQVSILISAPKNRATHILLEKTTSKMLKVVINFPKVVQQH